MCLPGTGTLEDCYLGFHTHDSACTMPICVIYLSMHHNFVSLHAQIQLNNVQMCLCQHASEAHSFRKTFIVVISEILHEKTITIPDISVYNKTAYLVFYKEN